MFKPKHVKALQLMMAVIDVHAQGVDVTRSWDKLYSYIFKHYAAPINYGSDLDLDAIDVRNLLNEQDQHEILNRLFALPPRYHDVIFPVVIARYLLRYTKVNISPHDSKTFEEFLRRYRDMITLAFERY